MNGLGADFSNDTIWVVLAKALFVFVFCVANVVIVIWAERRIISKMQYRVGPNRMGPFGIGQSLADGVKLAFKEDITPKNADKLVFTLAPAISAVMCFMAFAVIPFAGPVRIPFTDVVTPLQLTDNSVAVLYILAVTALGVYGIVLAGWSSGSTYPLLGGVRSTAQVISYELAMGLSLVAVFIFAGSMSTSQIVAQQAASGQWWVFPLLPAFCIYVVTMFGETNRTPFDLPEAEGELVGGFHTEYSSMKFAMFFLAEYVNMFTVSAVATTLFLGGWQAPWPLSMFGWANSGWWPLLWFTAKLWCFIFLFVWVRATLPRMRYDQLMRLGWKALIPLALAFLVIVSLIKGLTVFTDWPVQGLLLVLAAISAIAALILILQPERRASLLDDDADDGPFDAFAGGHPVPPMPGQSLPPSARIARRATVATSSPGHSAQPVAQQSTSTKPEVSGG